MNCPKCGAINRDDAKFCRTCGNTLPAPAAQVICPACQRSNRGGAKHCRHCGSALEGTRVCPQCQTENRLSAQHCRHCGKSLIEIPSIGAEPRVASNIGELAPMKIVQERYQVVYRIAHSETSAVYLAKDLQLETGREKMYALKEMAPAATAPEQGQNAVRQFSREAKMLARLNHPNLPRIVEDFSFAGNTFLVLEYIRGQTLAEILNKRRAPLPLEDALKWANQLFAVFQYLHEQTPPILYRDLEPGNVMLEEDSGLLKLIDFGVARFQRKHVAPADAEIGTPGYAAPEQWQLGTPTPQSDIYSLAVLLHQLVTNHDPATTPFNLPAITALNPAVPNEIANVIAKGSARAVSDRYASMRDFQSALQQATRRG